MISVGKPGWLEKCRPVAGPLDAIVKPKIIAACTSDVHTMINGGENPDMKNLILGHEAVGEVVEIGNMVKKIKPGDYVVVPSVTPDWMELGVQDGRSTVHDCGLSESFKFLRRKDGVMGELFHVNNADANLAMLPDGVSPEAALMTVDMMTTGFYAVEMADLASGDTVVVIGIGPVGLMSIAGCAIGRAGRIIGVGTRPVCVKVAKEYGATEIISYKEGDIVEQILKMTDGVGADRVIIAGGDQNTFRQAVEMTKAGGIISNVAFFNFSETLSMPAAAWGLGLSTKDIRCGLCPGGALRLRKLMELIKYGRVDAAKLITHRFYGFDQIENAFYLMAEKAPDLIKPIVYID